MTVYPPKILIINCLVPNFVKKQKELLQEKYSVSSVWLIYPLNTTWIGALMHSWNSTEQFEADVEH